jgi:phenylalanyl-tRNA synthetase beta chain
MPVINLNIADLHSLLGKDIPVDELVQRVPMIGADAGKPDEGILPVEFFPDRPDMFSVEGAARALRFFLASDEELESMELPEYPVKSSGLTMTVDASVGQVRPFVVGAVVRNVEMTDQLIQSLMDHQEKLHITIGRKRVKAAIGVHDLDPINGPFRYTTAPGDLSFIPLMKEREMTLTQILQRHEKGVAYAHILDEMENYPIILDRDQQVLSFPPIINGTLTTVTEGTTDIFIDVTGMELRPITLALNILCAAFAERGATIESIDISYAEDHPQFPGGNLTVPDLKPKDRTVRVAELNELLTTTLSAGEWILPFKRMGLRAEPTDTQTSLKVQYPAYRADILHDWDIFEDAAIGYGYQNIPSVPPSVQTTGKPLNIVSGIRKFQRTLSGMGYSEVKTLTLTGERDGYDSMGLPLPGDDIMVHNPITEDHTRLRTSLLPSLLGILRANRHRDLPQRIMEPGIIVREKGNQWMAAGVAIHSKAGFTEIKSTIETILPAFGKEWTIKSGEHPSFVNGRYAEIHVDGRIGYFGELHPSVITSFSLEYPVIGFEMMLSPLL